MHVVYNNFGRRPNGFGKNKWRSLQFGLRRQLSFFTRSIKLPKYIPFKGIFSNFQLRYRCAMLITFLTITNSKIPIVYITYHIVNKYVTWANRVYDSITSNQRSNCHRYWPKLQYQILILCCPLSLLQKWRREK